jgi:integrase
VFPARTGSEQPHIDKLAITRERARINAQLGIENATTHDLRSTLNSAASDLGIDKETRKALLGHKPAANDLISSTYLDADTLARERAALAAFETELNRLICTPPKEWERWGNVQRTV